MGHSTSLAMSTAVYDELLDLLAQLGYEVEGRGSVSSCAARREKAGFCWRPGGSRSRTPEVLRLVMSMVEAGQAFCVSRATTI